ncbi:MAG: hypothetical protein LBB76_09985 [Azoarcus sp.]|jgi:hypothetical protein|nr:hypothetical protein [Azoarcus sp.]
MPQSGDAAVCALDAIDNIHKVVQTSVLRTISSMAILHGVTEKQENDSEQQIIAALRISVAQTVLVSIQDSHPAI